MEGKAMDDRKAPRLNPHITCAGASDIDRGAFTIYMVGA